MSNITQFYYHDHVGDLRDFSTFPLNDYGGLSNNTINSSDIYDDGVKVYIRTGTYVLDPPDRLKSNTDFMDKWGRLHGYHVASHSMAREISGIAGTQSETFLDGGFVYANNSFIFAPGDNYYGCHGTSLVMRSDDDCATWEYVDIAPYVYNKIAEANGIPFIYSLDMGTGNHGIAQCMTNVFKSHDGGVTWTPVLPVGEIGQDGDSYNVLRVKYIEGKYFIVAVEGIWYSDDAYADTWQRLGYWGAGDGVGGRISEYRKVGGSSGTNNNNPRKADFGCCPMDIEYNGVKGYWYVSTRLSSTTERFRVFYNTTFSQTGWNPCTITGDAANAYVHLANCGSHGTYLYGDSGAKYITTTASTDAGSALEYTSGGGCYKIMYSPTYNTVYALTDSGVQVNSSPYYHFSPITAINVTGDTKPSEMIMVSGTLYISTNANTYIQTGATTFTNYAVPSNSVGQIYGDMIKYANGTFWRYGNFYTSTSGTACTTGPVMALSETDLSTFTTRKLLVNRGTYFLSDNAANLMIICCNSSIVTYNATTGTYKNTILPVGNAANSIMKTANGLYLTCNLYSTDLVTWNPASGGAKTIAYYAVAPNNYIVAVGGGSWRSATNGTSYTSMTTSLQWVDYRDNRFVAHTGGSIYVSNNWTSWIIANTMSTIRDMKWDEDRRSYLVEASGYGGRLWNPTDYNAIDMTWTSADPQNLIVRELKNGEHRSNGNNIVSFDIDSSSSLGIKIWGFGDSTIATPNTFNSSSMITQAFSCGEYYFAEIREHGTAGWVNYKALGDPPSDATLKCFVNPLEITTNSAGIGSRVAMSSTPTRWDTKSYQKWDNKYWFTITQPWDRPGWAELRKTHIYIPGDGTKYLRVL